LTNYVRYLEVSMANFSDLMDRLHVPAFFMRKNLSPVDSLKEDLQMMFGIFVIYLGSYYYGNHTICLLAMASMNIHFFQLGTNFHKLRNTFDTMELSCKQKEQGARVANPTSVDQNNLVNEQLQQVVRDTQVRNLKKNPSYTDMVNDEFDDLPPLIPVNECLQEKLRDTILRNRNRNAAPLATGDFGELPPLFRADEPEPAGFLYSENHYLRGYVGEID